MTLLLPAAKGFALGISLILAIGAQNAHVLRLGVLRHHVFAVCLICALCDALLIGAGALGMGALIASQDWLRQGAAWGGAAFLIWYAVRSLRSAFHPDAMQARAAGATGTLRQTVLTTLAVSLLNPHVYLDTVVLHGGVAAQFDGIARAAFALGGITASFVFFFALGYGARLLAPVFARPAAWRVLDLAVAALMLLIAWTLLREVVG